MDHGEHCRTDSRRKIRPRRGDRSKFRVTLSPWWPLDSKMCHFFSVSAACRRVLSRVTGVRIAKGFETSPNSQGKSRESMPGEPKEVPSCVKPADWRKLPAAVKAFVAAMIQATNPAGE
jgi:hypothetical protein